MGNDFCAFILSYGRADRVYTFNTLRAQGYTGKIYIVISDDDNQASEYVKKYGEQVLTFSKKEAAAAFDEADNFAERRAVVYARNACWKLAEKVGCKFFIQLDDDYSCFSYTVDGERKIQQVNVKKIKNLDRMFASFLAFFQAGNFRSVAMAQSGDFLGGVGGNATKASTSRKVMNSFFCSTDRPFRFVGKINEDLTTSVVAQSRGDLFLTIKDVALQQKQTQSNAGGLTDIYIASGTYVKSFYSVMFAPSCVKVRLMNSNHARLHHSVSWVHAVPKIVSERYRKATG
jgi:hypothetical protein